MSAVLLAAAVALVPTSASTVSVAYAGSPVATMEGPVAHALLLTGLAGHPRIFKGKHSA